MNDLIELAEKLGCKIAASERYRDLKAAEKAVDGDDGATGLFNGFIEQHNKMAALEAEGKPIEPEDKKVLMETREKVHANEKIQTLVRCQADFAELMSKVNGKMREMLEGSKDEGNDES